MFCFVLVMTVISRSVPEFKCSGFLFFFLLARTSVREHIYLFLRGHISTGTHRAFLLEHIVFSYWYTLERGHLCLSYRYTSLREHMCLSYRDTSAQEHISEGTHRFFTGTHRHRNTSVLFTGTHHRGNTSVWGQIGVGIISV